MSLLVSFYIPRARKMSFAFCFFIIFFCQINSHAQSKISVQDDLDDSENVSDDFDLIDKPEGKRQIVMSHEIMNPLFNFKSHTEPFLIYDEEEESKYFSKQRVNETTTMEPLEQNEESEEDSFPKYLDRFSELDLIDFNGCEKNFSCYGFPAGCTHSRNCLMSAKFINIKNHTNILLQASIFQGFVALGLSMDPFMGDDFVYACKIENQKLTVIASVNENRRNIALLDMKIKASIWSSDKNLYCLITADRNEYPINRDGKTIKSSDEIFLLLAVGLGKIQRDDDLTYHHVSVASVHPYRLRELILHPEIIYPKNDDSVYLHMIFAILAFVFFNPIAIFFAKYGQEAYSNKLIFFFPAPVWLVVHLGLHAFTIVFSILMVTTIAHGLRGDRPPGIYSSLHAILGVIATFWLYCDFFIGCFVSIQNEQKNSSFILKWLHWLIGNIVIFCSFACVFSSVHLHKSFLPCAFQYIAGLFIIIHIFTHLFMILHTHYLVSITTKTYIRRKTVLGPAIVFHKEDLPEWSQISRFDHLSFWDGRKKVLLFYSLICAIATFGLIGVTLFPYELCLYTI